MPTFALQNQSFTKAARRQNLLRTAIVAGSLAIAAQAFADSSGFDPTTTVAWTLPTERTDGSPYSALCCTNLLRGTKKDGSDLVGYKQVMGTQTSYLDTGLTVGLWCYATVVVSTDGSPLSERSEVRCYEMLAKPKTAPKAAAMVKP